ncbi:MAG: hypothetical protein KDD38_06925 [Bdellovibrionales bacterium]|nr:hypothetical protein [Bdellovibrionales bacterium]
MDVFREYFLFLKSHKKLWLIPILLCLLLLSALIYFSSGTVVAPFVYTLF